MRLWTVNKRACKNLINLVDRDEEYSDYESIDQFPMEPSFCS
jgi:hypothetical protein